MPEILQKGVPHDALPLANLRAVRDEVVLNAFLRGSREAAIYNVPDDAVTAGVGCELAPLPVDQKLQIVVSLHDSLDDGKTWEHVTTLFYSGTGSKFRPNGEPHLDPKAWGPMRSGKNRLLRCTYTPTIDLQTSISVRVT